MFPRTLKYLILLSFIPLSAAAATVDGIRIHSTITGKGPKTVFLVHGWTCDGRVWSEQVPALSRKYRVVTLDLPGHGESGMPTDGRFSIDLFARAVEAVRTEVKTDRIILVGHSMGAAVIVRYALMYPQHTSALVLVDGVTAGSNRPRRPSSMMSGPDGPKNREAMIRGMFSNTTTLELQSRILAMMLAAPEKTAVGALDATSEELSRDIGVLSIPALAVYADHSLLASPEYLHGHFANLEYTEIEGTGHFLMLEKPEDFNRILLRFLDEQELLTAISLKPCPGDFECNRELVLKKSPSWCLRGQQ